MTGFVLWFTGLSGSGKSTLAALVAAELRSRGVHVETLDGDEIRKNLSKGLGFSKEDRDVNVRRLGFVARLVARSGGCAITAAISPYRDIRSEVRAGVERFCEVYCECPVAVLAKRDPKGLYEKALRGEIKNFTGVDDPYEAPARPEVHLHTDSEEPAISAGRILDRLVELGFIGAPLTAGANALPPPYGGELAQRMTTAASPTGGTVRLDAVAEQTLVGMATGLLSPLTGFMSSREATKVERERHLERGLPWPAPIVLETADAVPLSGRIALSSPNDGTLGSLDVHEVWRDDAGRQFVAGDVFVEKLPRWAASCRGVEQVRRSLLTRGSTVALPIFTLPNLGDEHLARAALDVGEHVVLMPVLSPQLALPLVAACETLARSYLDPARVSVVPVPCPSSIAVAELLSIHAQNLGVTRLLLPARLRASSSAPPSAYAPNVAVHFYGPVRFDERIGSFVSEPGGAAPTADGGKRAETRRPEIAALDHSPK